MDEYKGEKRCVEVLRRLARWSVVRRDDGGLVAGEPPGKLSVAITASGEGTR